VISLEALEERPGSKVRFCLVSNLQKVSSFPNCRDRSDHLARAAQTTFSFEFWGFEVDGAASLACHWAVGMETAFFAIAKSAKQKS